MSISKSDNLFEVIGKHVATSEVPEFYLIAGPVGFHWHRYEYADTTDIDRVAAKGSRANTYGELVAHYASLERRYLSAAIFEDGCSGLVQFENVAVEFRAANISPSGRQIWRVLFRRVDAAALYLNLADRVKALERAQTPK